MTLPSEHHQDWSDQQKRDVAQSVVDQATQHPGDPAHWKPVEGGWLLQGTHDDAPVVVLVDDQGVVQDVQEGSFTGETTNSVRQAATALHTVLAGNDVTDPANAVVTMTLPHGSTVDVQWALDPNLQEGESYVGPASFTLTAAGWQQTAPATIVLPTTVRADPAEMVRDINRLAGQALAQLEARLPGPVGENVPTNAGRAPRVDGMRPGDVWQAPATSTSVDTGATPAGEPAPDAGDRLAAAMADLQTGDPDNGSRPGQSPVVAVTGNPARGPKLAHFADGSTVSFVVETTPDLPTGSVAVTPATWAFDGQEVRQTPQAARIRISDQLPGEDAAAGRQMAAMVDAGLRGLHDTLPAADRPHQTYNLLDLGRLGNIINPAEADTSDGDRVLLTPDPMLAMAPAAPGSGTPASMLVRLPGATGFAAEAQSVLEALAREGYQLSELREGWSDTGVPGMVVQVRPPADPLLPARPVELRLMTAEALDAYREVARQADQQRLTDAEVARRLAEHPAASRPGDANQVHLPSATDSAPQPLAAAPQPRSTRAPAPPPAPEADAGSGPDTESIYVDGYADGDDIRQHSDLVDRVRDGLLPQLPGIGRVPGLESAAPLGDGGLWELIYQGTPVQVWIAASPELPAGQASVSPGFIEVSSWTAPGVKGRTVTAAVLAKALAVYGEMVSSGAAPAARVGEQALANTDAFRGLDPTPESIADGTVRMEDHPDFPAVQQRLAELGFTMRPVTDHPAVQIRHIVDPDGNLIRVERELQYLEGMRFLDLEHELGHVQQLTERFPEGMPPHQVWTEHPDGRIIEIGNSPDRMSGWQIRVAEYHVRLEEYIRLAERGVDSAILEEHADGLDLAHDEYRKATKRGRSPSRTGWAQAHFPEIPALAERVEALRSRQDAARPRPTFNQPTPPDDPGQGLPKLPAPSDDSGQELFSRGGSRTNEDVFHNGGEVPLTLDAVQQAAELIGIDLSGIQVQVVTDPEYLRYLDFMGAVAVTPPELGGAEIHLGPASFVDAESLVATIAHEYTHVQQLRANAGVNSENIGSLEDSAYASEGPALERFRERVGSEQYDANGPLFSGDGVRPPDSGRSAGVGDGTGGRDLRRDGPAGRDDRGADDRARDRAGDSSRLGGRSEDAGAGADGSESGGRGPRPDQYDLSRRADSGEPLFSRGGARTNEDVFHTAGEVPLTLDAVQQAAELIGIDLSRVHVQVVTDPEYLRYLDFMGAVAVTPPELGGAEIHLGPASFVDAESLVATIAHEYTHVQQLRANAGVNSENIGSLEDSAYASEGPALERFRERVRSGEYDADGPLFSGEGVRPPAGRPEGPVPGPVTVADYWNDPPWRREGRPPSLDELLPTSEAEAARWREAVRAEFANLLDGQEFAGMRVRLDLSDQYSVTVDRDSVAVRMEVVDPERGLVGTSTWTFYRNGDDGSLFARHNHTALQDSAQGRGFTTDLERQLTDWLRYSGADRLEWRASGSGGGYAAARAGYDWAPHNEHRVTEVLRRLRTEMRGIRQGIEQIGQWLAGDQTVDIEQLRQRYGQPDPEALLTELRRQYGESQQLLERAARHEYGSPGYPTPFDVLRAGWTGESGRDASWPGKRALRGATFESVKPVSDTGPQFPRPPFVQDDSGAAQRDGSITAEQLPGSPGHGGPRDPPANLAAAVAAADDLAARHPRLPDQDHSLRFVSDPALGDVLFVDAAPDQPVVAFRFTSGPVTEGTIANTSLTGETIGGVPVYQTTISDSIPAADRPSVARRAVAHEVAETMDALRPRGFAERLLRRSPFSHHEMGILAELRLELADRAVAPDAAQGAYDQRIGHIVDRLGESRLDQVVAQLAAAGQGADALVRRLAAADAAWRGDWTAGRRDAARTAIDRALADLGRQQVGLLDHASRQGDTIRLGTRPGEAVYLRVGGEDGLVETLARSPEVGERLRVTAAAAIAERVAGLHRGDPALTAARALANLHELAPPERQAEYARALPVRLDGMRPDQLAMLQSEPLPQPVRDSLPGRMADALLPELLTALTGDGPDALAARARWRPDGGVSLPGRIRGRRVSSDVVEQIRDWLAGRIADGTTMDRARAELAGVLGAELGRAPRTSQPRVVGALTALGRLSQAQGVPPGTRTAAEALTGEVLADYSLRPNDWRALPQSARDLVSRAPEVVSSDRYAALRPGRYQDLVQGIAQGATALAAELAAGTGSVAAPAGDLARSAQRMADTLAEATSALDQRAQVRQGYAREATQRADTQTAEAADQLRPRVRDRWAAERNRTALVAAEQERAAAARHQRIAQRYESARELAGSARDAYQAVAAELAGATPAELATRVAQLPALAAQARQAFQAYRAAVTLTQPVLLDTGVPPDRLPYLNALTATVNRMVAAHGVDVTVQPDELQRALRSTWGWATGDEGTVIPLGFGAAEVRIAFRPGDAVEVLKPPQRAAEVIQAQLPQFPMGSRILGAAGHRTLDQDYGVPVGRVANAVGEAIPDDRPLLALVREGLRRVSLDVNFGRGRRSTFSGDGMPRFTVPGQVADNRGDSTLYNVDGRYEVQVRTTDPTARWSPVERVDSGDAADRNALEVAVEHTYTEPAPGPPEQLPSRPAGAQFPAHSLMRMSGLEDLSQTVLDLLGPSRDIARQQVYTMVREELPARLDQAIEDGQGFLRPIYDRGNPVALVRIRTRVVVDGAERLGTASDKHHLERLRVAFAGYGGAAEFGGSTHRSVTPGMSALPKLSGEDGGAANASLTGTYARESSWSDGIATGATAIRPNVQRYTGRTQAYQLKLVHEVSVLPFDGSGAAPGSRELTPKDAVVRMSELDAYRYGLPVDQAAVRERRADGTAVLVDDLHDGPPPGRADKPPAWLGEDGIPGAGSALVRNLTGAEEVRAAVVAALTDRGWLPTVVDGWPELSNNDMLRTAQVANLLELAELTGVRLEGAYDQAAQDGLVLGLTRHHIGRVPEHLTLRVRIEQNWEDHELLGHTMAETDVSLDIGSHRFVHQLGESRTRSAGSDLAGESGSDNAAQAGPMAATGQAGIGGAGRHPVSSRSEYGDIVNHVKLIEGQATGHTAIFRVPHTVTVFEVLANGDERELARADGAAELGISGDLLPERSPRSSPPRTAAAAAPTSARVLGPATLLHFDATGMLDGVREALPTRSVPGVASYDHLTSFIDTRTLMASPWWLYSDHGTNLVTDPRGGSAKRSSLWMRGVPGASEFLTVANLVVADVNLTMNVDGVRFGRELGGTGSLSASGELGDDPADPSGGAGGSGDADRARGSSRTTTRIYGRERLTIENSPHYIFRMPVDVELTGVEHRPTWQGGDRTGTATVAGRTAVYALSERVALDLYADGELAVPQEQVVDALRRWVDGRLELERRTVVGMLSRLHQDLDVAGETPAHFLPNNVLNAPGRLAGRIAERLAELFPDAAVPRGTTRVGDRVRTLVEQGLVLPEVAPDAARVRLPEHLENALGQGGIEAGAQLTREPAPDASNQQPVPADLADEVLRHIDTVVPDATVNTPGLAQGLIGQLAAEGWTGKLDRMLRPGGWTIDFPARSGFGTQRVTVELTASLSDGRLIGHTDTTGSVAQDYAFAQHDFGESRQRSYGLAAAGNSDLTGPAEVDGGLDRGYGGTAWANAQHTRIQRVSTFEGGLDRVRRDIRITVKVTRSGPPVEGRPPAAGSVLTGPVVHLVPPGLLVADAGTGADAGGGPATGQLPHRYFVESITADRLPELVREVLAQPHRLGADGLAQHEVALARQLAALPVNAGLDRMAGPAGHPAVTLPVPGRPDRLIQVTIRAEPVGEPRPIATGRDDVGLGQDDRQQHVLGHDSSRDRLFPASRGLAGEEELVGTGLQGKVTSGESSSQSYVIRRGDRDERKIYEEGTADTVAVPIRYTLTVVEKAVLAGGRERVISTPEEITETVPGVAYLTMFETDHAAMRGTAAAEGGELRSWLGEPSEPAGAPRRRPWQLPWPRRSPEAPVLALDELAAGAAQRPDHDPADPHAAIAGELRQALGDQAWRTAPVVHLTTTAAGVTNLDPQSLATRLATERGADVVIDVAHPDRTVRHHGHPEDPPAGGHRTVTASAVPRSEFHGYGRDLPAPEVVRRVGQEALDRALGQLPADAPVRLLRVELRPVAAASLTVVVDGEPREAVARSVPVDAQGRDLPPGTVPERGGGYRIEVSNRATDQAVERAMAHEVAELSEILRRAAQGADPSIPNALRPGASSEGAELSPHDLGRLAEVEVLTRMLEDPALAEYAHTELAALRDHLGLRPDDPGATARQQLVGQHLSDAAWTALASAALPATAGRTDVPFDFNRFYNDPQWANEATRFEQRLGSYYFNDPATIETARLAVRRLREVLVALAARSATESQAEFMRRVERAFFRDDRPETAGQVGTRVGLDDLLARGNLRELVTAFFNAAYFNRRAGTLSEALLDVIDNDRWDAARAAGVDVELVRAMREQLDESWNRVVLSRIADYQFDRNPFATGNVTMMSDRAFRDLTEVVRSQWSRRDRTPEEQQRLGLITTPDHYQRLGVPLGPLERAYVESVVGELTDHTPLPWREGVTAHETTTGRWARRIGREGFPVVDGVSATTTRMLLATRLVGLGGEQGERFLSALMGWLLPSRNHSLFEMLRGAQIAGIGDLDLRSPTARPAAVDLYRSLPGLDLHTVRTEVAEAGLLPHEARYLAHATNPDGFSETRHKVPDIASRLWPQLHTGQVTDPALGDWLRRNGVDPGDHTAVRRLGERLSLPHVMALAVYTRHSHYLINNVARTQLWTGGHSEAAVRARMAQKVDQLVANYLELLAEGRPPLPLPLALRPLLHVGEGHLTSRSRLDPLARQWVEATQRSAALAGQVEALRAAGRRVEARAARAQLAEARRVRGEAWANIRERLAGQAPALFDEMRWHADMLHDALTRLPTVGTPQTPVVAYRGDWTTPLHSPIYGSRLSPYGVAREFLSITWSLDVAVQFMAENPARGGRGRVLVVYRLTGQYARDISVFSSFEENQEGVLPPRSRTRRVSDPELVAEVRGRLPEQWRDRTEIIVMEEA